MATKKRVKDKPIDIDEGFKFIFRDKEWVSRLVIGGILFITIIGSPAVFGWALEIQRRVMRGQKVTPLPSWEPLGDYWVNGIKFLIILIIWQLPFLIPFYALYIGAFFLMMNGIETSAEFQQTFPPTFQLFVLAMQPIGIVVSIFFMVLMQLVMGHYAETFSFNESFRFGHVYKLFRANWKQFFGVALLGYGVSMAASFAGIALLCIGILFTTVAYQAITAHFYGQAYRNALAKVR